MIRYVEDDDFKVVYWAEIVYNDDGTLDMKIELICIIDKDDVSIPLETV